MLHKEMKELEINIEQLDLCLNTIYQILDEILSHPAKNYDLTFKKRRFELFHPFDKHEKLQVEKRRATYIKLLLSHVLDKRIKKFPQDYDAQFYEYLFALCHGEDPKDHQICKSYMEDVYKVRDEKDKKYGKKRPLDEDAYQVKMQLDKNGDDKDAKKVNS